MPRISKWSRWDGEPLRSDLKNPIIYHYPRNLDIEDPVNLNDLIDRLVFDKTVTTRRDARRTLETAEIIHGTIEDGTGEEHEWYGSEATWVIIGGPDEGI